jgi:lysophospholipase L1-like esterase
MGHVVLLGDSIFDNGVYVAPAPDVPAQLRGRLPGWEVTLLAVDGHVTADVQARQIGRLPKGATHLVVSVGGNDALGFSSVLTEAARSVAEATGRLAEARAQFQRGYERMVEAVAGKGLPTTLCTIYDANYPEPQKQLVVAGLALFNDVISRAAFSRGLPLVDLRLICSEAADYANPIEPSARGGEKITAAIARLVQADPAPSGPSTVWV